MSYKNIDQYIATFLPETQSILQKVRATIAQASPQATEAISYQMPTFKLNDKNLVHFAGYQHHIGFYPTPHGITAFDSELSSYKRAKGSVQFPLNQPIPYELIIKITKARVSEILDSK
jgi:uncharacterized protein YdhG (YjbR/CyaY superfamily)